MTYGEICGVLAILKAAYPHSFKDMGRADAETTAKLWQRMFTDDPASDVTAAVYALISTRKEGFSPTIGEVKDKIQFMRAADALSASGAWALVAKAARNGLYGYEAEFAKLPPAIQKTVGQASQLREWAMMDENTLNSVVASNFMRSYRAVAKQEEELAKLPTELRLMLADVTNKIMLDGDTHDEQSN